jgi:hypothetical protein
MQTVLNRKGVPFYYGGKPESVMDEASNRIANGSYYTDTVNSNIYVMNNKWKEITNSSELSSLVPGSDDIKQTETSVISDYHLFQTSISTYYTIDIEEVVSIYLPQTFGNACSWVAIEDTLSCGINIMDEPTRRFNILNFLGGIPNFVSKHYFFCDGVEWHLAKSFVPSIFGNSTLNTGETTIKGSPSNSSILNFGASVTGENIGTIGLNSQALVFKQHTEYNSNGRGNFTSINPSGFSSRCTLSPLASSNFYNGPDTANISLSDNKKFKFHPIIPNGSGETFTINGVTFTEGVDFTGQNDNSLDAATLASIDYSGVSNLISVEQIYGDVIFMFASPATVSTTFSVPYSYSSLLYYTKAFVSPVALFLTSGASQFKLSHTEHIFTDNTPTQNGIKYADDYSATFTDRSLVDKAYVDSQAGGGGGGVSNLSGSENYILVNGNKTSIVNGTELVSAYNLAKTKTPYGQPLSITNRFTVLVSPGSYNLTAPLILDTQFVDLVSLDGNCSVIFNSNTVGTISITANDVFVKGIDVLTKNFTIGTNLNKLKVENCKGGDYSFGGDESTGSYPITVNGTYTNCRGGNNSFGGSGYPLGVFDDCVGGDYSFGSLFGSANGTYTNCRGGNYSFGGSYAGTTGLFINCDGGIGSFGGENSGSEGLFINCRGGSKSFGGGFSYSEGEYINCKGGSESFGGDGYAANGIYTNCQGLSYSFGGSSSSGVASGVFTNCIGGASSFGGDSATLTGKLYYCRLTSGTFQTVSGAGITRYCIDGNDATNNQTVV